LAQLLGLPTDKPWAGQSIVDNQGKVPVHGYNWHWAVWVCVWGQCL